MRAACRWSSYLLLPCIGATACGTEVEDTGIEVSSIAGYYSLMSISHRSSTQVPLHEESALGGSLAFLEESFNKSGDTSGVFGTGRFAMRIRDCPPGFSAIVVHSTGTYRQFLDEIDLEHQQGLLFSIVDTLVSYEAADSTLSLEGESFQHRSHWGLTRADVTADDFKLRLTPPCSS